MYERQDMKDLIYRKENGAATPVDIWDDRGLGCKYASADRDIFTA